MQNNADVNTITCFRLLCHLSGAGVQQNVKKNNTCTRTYLCVYLAALNQCVQQSTNIQSYPGNVHTAGTGAICRQLRDVLCYRVLCSLWHGIVLALGSTSAHSRSELYLNVYPPLYSRRRLKQRLTLGTLVLLSLGHYDSLVDVFLLSSFAPSLFTCSLFSLFFPSDGDHLARYILWGILK